jgi:hypothetical protein
MVKQFNGTEGIISADNYIDPLTTVAIRAEPD